MQVNKKKIKKPWKKKRRNSQKTREVLVRIIQNNKVIKQTRILVRVRILCQKQVINHTKFQMLLKLKINNNKKWMKRKRKMILKIKIYSLKKKNYLILPFHY